MSEVPTLLTARHLEYMATHAPGEDEFLFSLRQAAKEAGIPAIQIHPLQGAFLRLLLRAAGARNVVEVGTLAGYSAMWIARALPPGGCLWTIEINPTHADFAAEWIARSDAAGKIRLLRGDAREHLQSLPAGSLDAAFLDADKKGYAEYLELCCRLLRPGGLLLADNAFAFGEIFAESPQDPETPAIRAFNERLAADPRFESMILPLGDGLWTCVYGVK